MDCTNSTVFGVLSALAMVMATLQLLGGTIQELQEQVQELENTAAECRAALDLSTTQRPILILLTVALFLTGVFIGWTASGGAGGAGVAKPADTTTVPKERGAQYCAVIGRHSHQLILRSTEERPDNNWYFICSRCSSKTTRMSYRCKECMYTLCGDCAAAWNRGKDIM